MRSTVLVIGLLISLASLGRPRNFIDNTLRSNNLQQKLISHHFGRQPDGSGCEEVFPALDDTPPAPLSTPEEEFSFFHTGAVAKALAPEIDRLIEKVASEPQSGSRAVLLSALRELKFGHGNWTNVQQLVTQLRNNPLTPHYDAYAPELRDILLPYLLPLDRHHRGTALELLSRLRPSDPDERMLIALAFTFDSPGMSARMERWQRAVRHPGRNRFGSGLITELAKQQAQSAIIENGLAASDPNGKDKAGAVTSEVISRLMRQITQEDPDQLGEWEELRWVVDEMMSQPHSKLDTYALFNLRHKLAQPVAYSELDPRLHIYREVKAKLLKIAAAN